MVSAQACVRKSEKTFALLHRADGEELLGIQIFGSEPLRIARAVAEINRYNPTLIDLNCGCSIPKILKSGSGAALLKTPGKIGEIIKAIKNETDVPVTLKIRSGWDVSSLNYKEVGNIAADAGAALITLHPRTRAALFSGHSVWEHIAGLKQAVSIPVVGSGDLFTPQDIHTMLVQTGCDGVMIARGAIGNPFLFSRVRALYSNEPYHISISPETRLSCAMDHLDKSIALKGPDRACKEMRKHFCAYTKGLPHSAAIRRKCVQAKNRKDYDVIIREYLSGLAQD
jgi:nifR3 family TIM-barrel protein